MKSRSKKSRKKTLTLTKEMKDALRWANSLSTEQKAWFEQQGVLYAERLMRKEYLRFKENKKRKQRR